MGTGDLEGVDIEYVVPDFDFEDLEGFENVIQRFTPDEPEEEEKPEDKGEKKAKLLDAGSDDEDEDEEDEAEKGKISRKARKLAARPTVAALKQLTSRPEVVEIWDRTSADPGLCVSLKAARNTVPVPRHWSQKRKYMQGKRGIEKPPFQLPEYIESTGIARIRQAIQEKDALKTTRQKQREKVRPKTGKMEIDYQVLHDAFFKFATKPRMTKIGDMYYEGKENEIKMRKYKPGQLSDNLKQALGMMEALSPPPWLVNMQRYGPPPSYPNLRIPGLNAPIPYGAEFGFHIGGWGKPPVDDDGNPLYGMISENAGEYAEDEPLWGEVEEAPEEEEEEEEEELPEAGGMATPAQSSVAGHETPLDSGLHSVSGIRSIGASSVTSGLDTPESVDLRRRATPSSLSTGTNSRRPYTVLEQHNAPSHPGALFQSTTVYRMPASGLVTPPIGTVTPLGGSVTPIGGTVTPIGGTVTPIGGTVTPLGGTVTPIGGTVTPLGGTVTPIGGTVTPLGGTVTPIGGTVTPLGGTVTPIGGTVTPLGGTVTPIGGTVTPGGAVTPNSNTRK